ncbi:MAG: hypothetical protein KGK07_12940 [Chloroflexota bacterium]|nr:hypothetical protein [Chloroflexota bacterium]
MGTHRWRGYVVAALASATLAAGAVCGSPGRQAAPTVPVGAPPSAVAGAQTVYVPPVPLVVHTPLPGAAQAGLFADGITNLATVSTTTWKTYSNSTYGFTFKYPANWSLSETDSAGHYGPNGEPSYPLHSVSVTNPAAEQGANVPGKNCNQSSCIGPPPKMLGFYVAIWNSQCGAAGDLVVSDKWTIDGKQGSRCVLQSQNDNASRFTYISFPEGDGINFLTVSLEKGRGVLPSEQQVLETILSTFTFAVASTP